MRDLWRSMDAEGQPDYQEHEENCEKLSEEECEELDNVFNNLMKLVDERMLTVQQAEDLVEWAEINLRKETLRSGFQESY